MKKIPIFLTAILLLLSCMTPLTARADSQSTTVRYSVPATITYRDYDGTSTTQKVEVGTILKEPKAKGKPGCTFEGWKNAKTGLLWDFATPVTEHMTFTASYSEFQEDAEGRVPIGDGTFSVSIKVENHATDVSVGTSSKELLDALVEDGSITSGELEQIADGASMEIVLLVKDGADTIAAASRNQLQQTAAGYTIGQYLDISLVKYLTVNGETEAGQLIRETSGMITVTLKIPHAMINTDQSVERSYIVLRNHDGQVEILDSEYHADAQTLTFRTNRFSDYAIAYRDVKKSGQGNGNSENSSQSSDGSGSAVRSPRTGDMSRLSEYGILLLLSMMGLAILLYTGKKRNEK